MRLGHRILGGPHGHADDGSGGHIVRPRLYENVAVIGFLGRRRRVYDRLVALSGARPGDRVLDIGCGTGYLTRRAAAAVGPAGSVVGVDPSPQVIVYARKRRTSGMTFHLAGGEAIPEPEASFDVVVSSLAVHHVPPPLRSTMMREAARVLRPGGTLLIADFRPPRSRIGGHLIGAVSGHAMRHNPIHELRRLIGDAGFDITGEGDLWPMLHYVRATRAS